MPASRPRRAALLGAALALLLGGTATLASASASASAASASASAKPGCGSPDPKLDRRSFPARPRVDNPWFPLAPGTRWVLTGSVAGSSHRVVTTVTDLTKVVDGVRTLVLRDEDLDGTNLQEAELAFFAQQRGGTVWGLGEYPELYDHGKLTGAPDTWITGIDGAHGGYAMLARPHLGTGPYVQGDTPAIAFLDCAKVQRTRLTLKTPAGTFHQVLETNEWSPNDPSGGHQLKRYAPGVGLIQALPVGGNDPETLVLTSLTHLSRAALDAVDQQVIAMDKRGYRVSPHVYGQTPPVSRTAARMPSRK